MKHGVLRIVDTQLDRALARDGHREPADGIGAIESLYVALRAARADRDARFRFAAFRHAAPNDGRIRVRGGGRHLGAHDLGVEPGDADRMALRFERQLLRARIVFAEPRLSTIGFALQLRGARRDHGARRREARQSRTVRGRREGVEIGKRGRFIRAGARSARGGLAAGAIGHCSALPIQAVPK